ncbi:MAG: sodium:proton antiporter [Chloroflexi bacterium]|jgi:NhaP-type Na+/H+ or K+/H+ antiporter|nr:sodium:proton antiporter [Chloroflexota bacterium]
MEESVALVAVLLCILIAAAISKRIQGTIITLPMIYTLLGLILSSRALGLIELGLEDELIRIIAEVTLILVLATDASRINVRMLIRDHSLPQRLLVIGLPLMMIIGTLVAAMLFIDLTFWEAAVLAIILTPTDASLGQAVVSNPKVPVRIRQTLNVESGLNDGIAMPFLLLALSLAASEQDPLGPSYWLSLALAQIVFGILVGLIIGFLGGRFVEWGQKSGWMSKAFQKISLITLALLAYGAAELVDGNGFIAAFVMGMTAANTTRKEETESLYEYAEVEVQGLMMLTFMIVFGLVMLPLALDEFNGLMLLYAVLSLALFRLLAVGASLIRTKVKPVTTGFIGWFGPRGIASILYIFTVLDEDLAGETLIYNIVMLTVLISIFAHGVTAAPGAKWYAKRVEGVVESEGTEMQEVPEMPVRGNARLEG